MVSFCPLKILYRSITPLPALDTARHRQGGGHNRTTLEREKEAPSNKSRDERPAKPVTYVPCGSSRVDGGPEENARRILGVPMRCERLPLICFSSFLVPVVWFGSGCLFVYVGVWRRRRPAAGPCCSIRRGTRTQGRGSVCARADVVCTYNWVVSKGGRQASATGRPRAVAEKDGPRGESCDGTEGRKIFRWWCCMTG